MPKTYLWIEDRKDKAGYTFWCTLMDQLTRNTGFEVSKGTIGACWIVSCCGWSERIENDACGLDRRRLSLEDKMKNIYAGTSLRQKLLSAGLEVHQ